MDRYCNRYLDDAPGIRGECQRHLESGKRCVTCPNRDIQREVVDLRKRLRSRPLPPDEVG